MSTTKKRMEFVGRHSNQGNRIIIIVPKEYKHSINKLRNPMRVTVEEII